MPSLLNGQGTPGSKFDVANKVKAGLQHLDHDGSGFIDRKALKDFFHRLCRLSPRDSSVFNLLLDKADSRSDGHIHFSSFVDELFGSVQEPKHSPLERPPEIITWVSSVRLKGAMPSRAALRELLYGDPTNSAEGADVIAVLLTELPLDEESGEPLQHLLRDVIKDAESYIFNEDDENLVIEGVPAQLSRITSENKHLYVGMYVCVHRRSAQGGLSETFPVPPCLACGTRDYVGDDLYNYRHSVMLVDVLLQAPLVNNLSRPVHLMLCGANLSEDFSAQMKQLRQLERQLGTRHRTGEAFTAVLVGNLSHFIVCGEDFSDFIGELEPEVKGKKKKKEKRDNVETQPRDFQLNTAGVEDLCRRLGDAEARRNLFLTGSLHFTGKDCFGNHTERPPQCAQMLKALFELNHDWIRRTGAEVPMPSVVRVSMDQLWSDALGFHVRMPVLVTTDMLRIAVQNLHAPKETVEDLLNFYMPTTEPKSKAHARVIKTNLGDALYLQCGWMDGIGVYKGSNCPSELITWGSDDSIFSFDHVPVKGSVRLAPQGGDPLRIWVASVKLDNRKPSKEALRALLYGTEDNSALGADVIALFLTDLDVKKKSVKELQHLLRNTFDAEERDKYVFNEEETGLVLKAIPAQLVKAQSGKSRYVSMHVCIKKELVVDFDGDGIVGEVEDAFPEGPGLVCRSDMKNEAAPSFKGHIDQRVVIKCPTAPNGVLHLMLLGLNFDTEDGARERQVERLLRYLYFFGKEELDRQFAAVIFGDFNNRLICPDWLSPHVSWKGEGKVKDPVLQISGATILCEKLATAEQRLELQQSLDSWVFQGRDATGKDISIPKASQELRKHFHLYFDVCKSAVPLPTYKRTPLSEALNEQAGFDLDVTELVTHAQVVRGFRSLQSLDSGEGAITNVKAVYFGNREQTNLVVPGGRRQSLALQCSYATMPDVNHEEATDDFCATMLNCGWPDSVGTYRHSVLVRAELISWGTCESITGSIDAAPIRGRVRVILN